MGLARMLPRTEVLVVTTPPVAAQKVAARAADMARKGHLRVAGVIENMSAFTCDHGTAYALFGAGGGARLAAEIGVPLVGEVPLHPDMTAAGDAGTPVALGDGVARRWPSTPSPPASSSRSHRWSSSRAAPPGCSTGSRRPWTTPASEPAHARRRVRPSTPTRASMSSRDRSARAAPVGRRAGGDGPTATSGPPATARRARRRRRREAARPPWPRRRAARARATAASRVRRWAMIPATVAAGSVISEPWPGAMVARGGSRSRSRRRLARYCVMSPSGGAITTVEPCMTWSPEKSMPSSTSSQHRWLEAWPGVCSARSVEAGPGAARSPRPPTRRVRSRRGRRSRGPRRRCAPPGPAAPGEWSGWVWVTTIQRMRPAPQLGQRVQVGLVVGAGVDHHQVVGAHQVGVGPGSRSSCPGWGP